MEEFLGLLYEFDQGGEGRSAVELFGQLKPVLKEWPELLRDFAAFLLPEQALECGLVPCPSPTHLRTIDVHRGALNLKPLSWSHMLSLSHTPSLPSPVCRAAGLRTQSPFSAPARDQLRGEFIALPEDSACIAGRPRPQSRRHRGGTCWSVTFHTRMSDTLQHTMVYVMHYVICKC